MVEPDTSSLPILPVRDSRAHKGEFGTVAIIGGSIGADSEMIGAPALAARAALRAGSGLVRLVMPDRILAHALAIEPSATGIPVACADSGSIEGHAFAPVIDRAGRESDAIAIGPGLGTDAGAEAAVLRAIKQEGPPVVVDADGLNVLAEMPEAAREIRARCVLTPHPGEFRRLASGLEIEADPVDPAGRARAAAELAQRLGCVVVLKGAGTVVSDGLRAWTCARGHPALATAGTGDVLTGILASVIGQLVQAAPMPGLPERFREAMPADPKRPLDLYDAARVAVEAHAIAGERWADRHGASGGLLARELADEVPGVLEEMRRTP